MQSKSDSKLVAGLPLFSVRRNVNDIERFAFQSERSRRFLMRESSQARFMGYAVLLNPCALICMKEPAEPDYHNALYLLQSDQTADARSRNALKRRAVAESVIADAIGDYIAGTFHTSAKARQAFSAIDSEMLRVAMQNGLEAKEQR